MGLGVMDTMSACVNVCACACLCVFKKGEMRHFSSLGHPGEGKPRMSGRPAAHITPISTSPTIFIIFLPYLQSFKTFLCTELTSYTRKQPLSFQNTGLHYSVNCRAFHVLFVSPLHDTVKQYSKKNICVWFISLVYQLMQILKLFYIWQYIAWLHLIGNNKQTRQYTD